MVLQVVYQLLLHHFLVGWMRQIAPESMVLSENKWKDYDKIIVVWKGQRHLLSLGHPRGLLRMNVSAYFYICCRDRILR